MEGSSGGCGSLSLGTQLCIVLSSEQILLTIIVPPAHCTLWIVKHFQDHALIFNCIPAVGGWYYYTHFPEETEIQSIVSCTSHTACE